jgi:putative Ca2+/H+ antiporter (TMEM165/GDT1 family)
MSVPIPADPNVAAMGASFTAITLAELGDKTFFMALILATRHRGRYVFLGAFAALAAVRLISLGVGYGLRELLPMSVLPWLAAALFTAFGLKLLVDAQRMGADADEEERDAQEAIEAAEGRRRVTLPWAVITEAFRLLSLQQAYN